MYLNTRIFFLFIFILLYSSVLAQKTFTTYPIKYKWSIGADVGTTLFFGDVAQYNSPFQKQMDEYQLIYGISLRKKLNPVITNGLRFQFGGISGQKAHFKNGIPANHEFNTSFTEFSYILSFDLVRALSKRDKKYGAYFIAGVGVVNYYARKYNFITNETIGTVGYNELGTVKSKANNDIIVPFGVGAAYAINRNFNVNLDYVCRYVNSDKLDAHEGVTDTRDYFGALTMGIAYKLHFNEKRKPHPLAWDSEENPDGYQDYVANDSKPVDTVQNTFIDTTTVYNPPDNTDNNIIPFVDTTTLITNIVNGIKKDSVAIVDNTIEPVPVVNIDDNKNNTNNTPLITYKLQLLASYKKPVSMVEFKNKHNIPFEIIEEKENDWYKYVIGEYNSLAEVKRYKKMLLDMGVKDVYMVSYADGKRIIPGSSNISSSNTVIKQLEPNSIIENTTETEIKQTKIFYTIQVAASRKLADPLYLGKNLSLNALYQTHHQDGWYRYSYGIYASYSQAEVARNTLIKNGIKNCFITAYKEGVRFIPVKQ